MGPPKRYKSELRENVGDPASVSDVCDVGTPQQKKWHQPPQLRMLEGSQWLEVEPDLNGSLPGRALYRECTEKQSEGEGIGMETKARIGRK